MQDRYFYLTAKADKKRQKIRVLSNSSPSGFQSSLVGNTVTDITTIHRRTVCMVPRVTKCQEEGRKKRGRRTEEKRKNEEESSLV